MLALAVTVPLGYLLRFHLPVPELARDAAGGAAYAVAASLALLVAAPRLTAAGAAGLGFAFTCAVEISQLISTPWLDAVRATGLGRMALGTTFSWADFGPYGAGGLIAWAIAAALPRRPPPRA